MEPQVQAPQPVQPRRKKIYFTGHFMDYFIKSIGLFVLCALTLGILFPYFVYWNAKYFVDNLEIEA
jgi:uncharacterized membrane protein YjgN (DUF898 family)